jgi:3-isopropylmalate/(R)-2-methylmalate dehydratase small subunit
MFTSVQVSIAFARIFKAIEADPKTELEVNLPEQIITLKQLEKESLISGYKKDNMINGFDDYYLQNIKEEVVAFANQLPY